MLNSPLPLKSFSIVYATVKVHAAAIIFIPRNMDASALVHNVFAY